LTKLDAFILDALDNCFVN